MPCYLVAASDWQTSEEKQNVWEILQVIYQVPLISILPTEFLAENLNKSGRLGAGSILLLAKRTLPEGFVT